MSELHGKIMVCPDCELAKSRTRAVPGDGPGNAEFMFIGEAPGWHEDQQGRPFVGPAGQFLNELIEKARLKRASVFITNIVKCRPPGNRDPLPGEIEACRKYLDRQIELIRPKVIVTLGRHSMGRHFPGESIGKIHGRGKKMDGFICVAMYHPAAALHQGGLRKVIEQDMAKLPHILAEINQEAEAAGPTPAQQAKLF